MTSSGESTYHAAPIGFDRLDSIFGCFLAFQRVALAVSGGADSVALMVLAEMWRQRQAVPPEIVVLTVDHGLRPQAADEAAWVKQQAEKLGLRHETLMWTGPKPRTGLQAAARAARYALMLDFCRKAGCGALATAHTAEDQAETLLMRLRRGSGIGGLAAIPSASARGGVAILRVLLGLSRRNLEASLRQRGFNWIEDPSNRDTRYERVRLREALKAETMGLTAAALALSAKRLNRADRALERVTKAFLAAALEIHPAGYGALDRTALELAPDEIALRCLERLAFAFGGGQRPVRLARIESLREALMHGSARTYTLGGCLFTLRSRVLHVMREYGRIAAEAVPLPPSGMFCWDGRFEITASAHPDEGLLVGALGPEGLSRLRQIGGRIDFPARAAYALPAFRRNDTLVYVPSIRFDEAEPPAWRKGFEALFTGSDFLSSGAQAWPLQSEWACRMPETAKNRRHH